MDLSGATLGQYQIIEQVGRGGMATVYKAYQASLDRYVAVKVLTTDLADSDRFVVRFEREAKSIARLRHRNILTVFDYGHQADIFYLVTEYVSGGTLKDKFGWPQDLPYAVNIIFQVGDALAYAHRQGTIHRDVKPGNILMMEEDWPLLSDFGLAKIIEGTLSASASETNAGTPQYMSPEQAQGIPVDQRSDIYSLGVVLYEAVTGQPPFANDNPLAIIFKHVSDPIVPPRTLRSDLPADLEQVILKALAKSPNHRYQLMEEFLVALQKAYPIPRFNVVPPNNLPAESESRRPPGWPKSRANPAGLPQPRRSLPWMELIVGGILLLLLILSLLLLREAIVPLGAASTQTVEIIPASPGTAAAHLEPEPSAGSNSPDLSLETRPPATPSEAVTISLSSPLTVTVRRAPIDDAEMVFVPAGTFLMGSERLGEDERPLHRVYLDDFWIDRYEVTNERFARFVSETGYQTEAEQRGWGWVRTGSDWVELPGADWRHPRGPGSSIADKPNHPVVLAGWADADAYCRWAEKRLPLEAEWEKAARGPVLTEEEIRRYPWGESWDSSLANTSEADLADTTPVGSFSPQGDSPYGAADMAGNVWEWVADWYGSDYYSRSPASNPAGPETGTYKILRGGSWLFDQVYARTAFRYNINPDYTYDFTGFRCSSQ